MKNVRPGVVAGMVRVRLPAFHVASGDSWAAGTVCAVAAIGQAEARRTSAAALRKGSKKEIRDASEVMERAEEGGNRSGKSI